MRLIGGKGKEGEDAEERDGGGLDDEEKLLIEVTATRPRPLAQRGIGELSAPSHARRRASCARSSSAKSRRQAGP